MRSVFLMLTLTHVLVHGDSFPDWLVQDLTWPTQLKDTSQGNIVLTNGLISREFTLKPDFATVDYFSHEKDASLLRAVGPEAVICLDGTNYNVGGLLTNAPRAYLNRTALAEDMRPDPQAFHYSGHAFAHPEAPFKYTPGRRGAPQSVQWPPKGLRLDVNFTAPASAPELHQNVMVTLHYEMYDGAPLMAKWLTIRAAPASQKVALSVLSVEYLAVNWDWASEQVTPARGHLIGTRSKIDVYGYGWFVVETDQAHNGLARWERDSSQKQMPGSFQAIVNATYEFPATLPIGPEGFESFRTTELVVGTSDLERRGLARKRKMRLLAPQTLENPLYFHSKNSSSAVIKSLIDQLSEVGFEMLVYSFGSGFNYESSDKGYLQEIAGHVKLAKSKGLEMGGYDLLSLSRYLPWSWWRDVPPPGHKGSGACFASGWYDYVLDRVTKFMDQTGMTVLISDGPYGGYPCYSTNHSHHQGYQDSVHMQGQLQNQFFTIMRNRGVYITQPDLYFYHGANRGPMGYDEMQYSLPRWQDLSITRAQIYDHTHFYLPTRGYVMVPMLEYHGAPNPQQATFQPASKHKVEFEWVLAQYLGAGVGIHFRGDELFDDEDTKAIVKKWVGFYKKYRDILTSEIIHIQRPNMQSIDGFIHVNPRLQNKGLAMMFNPTLSRIAKNMSLPLYYTGLTDTAVVSEQEGPPRKVQLDRQYNVQVHVDIQPLSVTWFLIQ